MTPEMASVLTQAPFAVIILVAGFYLYKENNKREENWRKVISDNAKSSNDALKETAAAHHEALSELVEANQNELKKMTKQLSKNTAVLLLALSEGMDANALAKHEIEKILNGD